MSSRSDIQVVEVTTRKQRKAFVDFFYDLYRDSPYAVPYLYLAEKLTLKPGSNPRSSFARLNASLPITTARSWAVWQP